MDFDPRQIVALLAAGFVVAVGVLSYTAAYLIGRGHGRRLAEREHEAARRQGGEDRLQVVEEAVQQISRSLTRLTDAQRVLLLAHQQERAARPTAPGEQLAAGLSPRRPRLPGADTPA
jgi:hypothetical protein